MADITGAGVNPIGIVNATGTQVNPATYDKQVEMITYLAELVGNDYDTITATYPSEPVEVYTYSLSGATVKTVTVTYTDYTKSVLSTVVIS